MKKITFLISSLAGGGAEGVCVNIANGLADSGWSVDLVILHTHNATYLERVNPSVNLIVLNVNHARSASIPLLKYILRRKPEKILIFNYELAVLTVMLRSFFRFKVKIIARNINTFSKNKTQPSSLWHRYIIKPLINYFYCKTDHIINQCQAMCDDLLTVYPQLVNQTSVIYNPVAKHIEEYALNHNLTNIVKQDYLLCIGRLENQKAFHYAIEAFSKLKDSYPELRLKIIGKGGLEVNLQQTAINLGVIDKVDFEGFKSDIIDYYLHAKATLLTSLYEGFPNVLIESITLGTPVISFDCPSGPSEIIKQGINGYLVEYKNVDSFVESCHILLKDKVQIEPILATANAYSTKVAVEQYSNLLINFRVK
ncbi:TPA: glycosyltransferase [Providencia alcalifaciens]